MFLAAPLRAQYLAVAQWLSLCCRRDISAGWVLTSLCLCWLRIWVKVWCLAVPCRWERCHRHFCRWHQGKKRYAETEALHGCVSLSLVAERGLERVWHTTSVQGLWAYYCSWESWGMPQSMLVGRRHLLRREEEHYSWSEITRRLSHLFLQSGWQGSQPPPAWN